MEIVTTLPPDTPLSQVARVARRIETLGYDTVHVPETVHDSLAVALLVAEHTERITIRTSMTVAFPRSPMVLALAAWDLARFSGGRFQLGLGTQVRANVVDRFSTAWSDPAGQLADYLAALRAIFDAFAGRSRLAHEGPHYRFTRLQPYFNPGPLTVSEPTLWTGAVNRRLCRVAGGSADGFVAHLTNSHPTFLARSLLPALAEGAAAAGRTDGGPAVIASPRSITAVDAAGLDSAREVVREELAFLYTTAAYRPTLDLIGHGELSSTLADLARAGDWSALPGRLTDDILADLVPQALFADLPATLHHWFAGRCDGLNIALPADPTHDTVFAQVLAEVRSIPGRPAVPSPPEASPSDASSDERPPA